MKSITFIAFFLLAAGSANADSHETQAPSDTLLPLSKSSKMAKKGGGKSSKGIKGTKSSKSTTSSPTADGNNLDWLSGQWWLCDERQTRLMNNVKYRNITSTTECSKIFGFKITSLTDDNMNFKRTDGNATPMGKDRDQRSLRPGAVSLNPK